MLEASIDSPHPWGCFCDEYQPATARDDAKAAHPSQVRRGSVADDPDQPQADGTSPAAGLGDLDNIVVDLNDAIQRLRKLKRKPTS